MSKDEFMAALNNPSLDIFSAVRMARADAWAGDFVACFARLRVDADKVRCFDLKLYQSVCSEQIPEWVNP